MVMGVVGHLLAQPTGVWVTRFLYGAAHGSIPSEILSWAASRHERTRGIRYGPEESIDFIKEVAASGAKGPPASWASPQIEFPSDVGRFEFVSSIYGRSATYGSERSRARSTILDFLHNVVGTMDLGDDGSARFGGRCRYQPSNDNRRRRHPEAAGLCSQSARLS